MFEIYLIKIRGYSTKKILVCLKPATNVAILYADLGKFDRKRFSPPIDADRPGDFFRRSRRCGSFQKSCDKIAQPDSLALLAIDSNNRRKSREWAHLANAGEFNRRYLTCQISAILYVDRGDRRKSESLHRAHLATFADRGDRRIKSPSKSLSSHQFGRFYHMTFQNCHTAEIGEKIAKCVRNNRWRNRLRFSAPDDQIRRDRRIKSPGVSLA